MISVHIYVYVYLRIHTYTLYIYIYTYIHIHTLIHASIHVSSVAPPGVLAKLLAEVPEHRWQLGEDGDHRGASEATAQPRSH